MSGTSNRLSLDGLAARVDANARAITQLTETIERSHQSLSQDLRRLTERQVDSHKTPWSTLAAWAGVMLTFGALMFGGLAWNMQRIENASIRNYDLLMQQFRTETDLKIKAIKHD